MRQKQQGTIFFNSIFYNKKKKKLKICYEFRLLKELGAPKTARLYIASGEPFEDDEAILPLKAEFPNVVTKEMLARDGELDPYRNKTLILTAIDYIVSLSSDVFLPSFDGNMVRALQVYELIFLIFTSFNLDMIW